MRNCTACNQAIPAERLEVLPDTRHCVACSTTKKKLGFTLSFFSKGTASELALVDPTNKEQLRRAIRANRRSR